MKNIVLIIFFLWVFNIPMNGQPKGSIRMIEFKPGSLKIEFKLPRPDQFGGITKGRELSGNLFPQFPSELGGIPNPVVFKTTKVSPSIGPELIPNTEVYRHANLTSQWSRLDLYGEKSYFPRVEPYLSEISVPPYKGIQNNYVPDLIASGISVHQNHPIVPGIDKQKTIITELDFEPFPKYNYNNHGSVQLGSSFYTRWQRIIERPYLHEQSSCRKEQKDCPIIEEEELKWISELLKRYKIFEMRVLPILGDIRAYLPENSFVSIEKQPYGFYLPATKGVDARPLIFATDFDGEGGGGAVLVKLLCSIQTKNIKHGPIYLVIASNFKNDYFSNYLDGFSVVISKRNGLLDSVLCDTILYYDSTTPRIILSVERECEKIIYKSTGTGERGRFVAGIPSIPLPDKVDSLTTRFVNYLSANTHITLRKKLIEEVEQMPGNVTLKVLEGGDILIHFQPNCKNNCKNAVVFLSQIAPAVKVIDNPEQHIKKNKFVIKSDGKGVIGLKSRAGVFVGMELLRRITSDTTSYDYYLMFSNNNNNNIVTDISRIVGTDCDNVLVFNDGLHQIINDLPITVINKNYKVDIRNANSISESINIKRLRKVLDNLMCIISKR